MVAHRIGWPAWPELRLDQGSRRGS
jgi:hypothetical protein